MRAEELIRVIEERLGAENKSPFCFVLQCSNCGEFLIEDAVMARVDAIIDSIARDVEVEVFRYAA